MDAEYKGRINTVLPGSYVVAEMVKKADVLIGAVLLPGASVPKTVSEEMVKTMKKGSVIVDVAIDQGGTVETIDRITTHDNPAYEKYGVIHYSVANMPGAVPHTSTQAFTGVTLPWLRLLADKGVISALKQHKPLRLGLNTFNGEITCAPVAEAMDAEAMDAEKVLSGM